MSKSGKISFLMVAMALLLWLTSPVYAEAAARIRIDPPTQKVNAGDAFSIDVRVEDVKDLLGWQFDISYDSAEVEFVKVTEGTFLKNEGQTLFIEGNKREGAVRNIAATLLGEDGVDSSGVVAKAYFKLLKKGSAKINLENHLLSDPAARSFDHTVENGGVNLSAEELQEQVGGATGSSSTPESSAKSDSANSKSRQTVAEDKADKNSSDVEKSKNLSPNDKDETNRSDKTKTNNTNSSKGALWILVIGILVTVVPLVVLFTLKWRRLKRK